MKKANVNGILLGLALAFIGSALPQVWSVYDRHRQEREAVFDLRAELTENREILEAVQQELKGTSAPKWLLGENRLTSGLSFAAYEGNFIRLAHEDDSFVHCVLEYYAQLRQVANTQADLKASAQYWIQQSRDIQEELDKTLTYREFLVSNFKAIPDIPRKLKDLDREAAAITRLQAKLRPLEANGLNTEARLLSGQIKLALVDDSAATSALDGMSAHSKELDAFLTTGVIVGISLLVLVFLHSLPIKRNPAPWDWP